MIRTFNKGGVHPHENKISARSGIQGLPVPGSVAIILSQHLGAPAKPVVNRGDEVKTGQIIAKGDGFISSNVHASVSGKVIKIDVADDVSGYKRPAVFIEVSGDEWLDNIIRDGSVDREIKLNGTEIINRISESGIVGLGGATFPSHVKLTIPRGKKVDNLIINGVECEPFLTADHALMLEKGEELMVGVKILMKALNLNKAVIGIENNKPDAIQHLQSLSAQYGGIQIQPLKVKYPQGGEKQLIKAITGREIPSGGLPMDVGALVFNVGSVFSIYEAVQKNKPLFERIVTVTGRSVSKPSNLRVRIGTPVSALIEAAGGLPSDTGKIICGGPMMGKALSNTEIPVVKGTSGILMLPDSESRRHKILPCVRCGKCVDVCPMGLEPYLLMPLSQHDHFDALERAHVMDCIECGSCSYICPARRPLLDYIRLAKANVGKIIRTRRKP
ncbi:MAG: electron transport complex subunit RsxC [Bacteroidales bacterium]|nr:electron transport complex subunit RsxC [Bacteroidales bacterium]